MAYVEGPGTHTPNTCCTLTLADLGDTEGFGIPGKLQIFGLELMKDGYYKRSASVIPTVQLPEADLDIKLDVWPPYVYLEQNTLVSWENTGKMLASFQQQGTVGAIPSTVLSTLQVGTFTVDLMCATIIYKCSTRAVKHAAVMQVARTKVNMCILAWTDSKTVDKEFKFITDNMSPGNNILILT